MRADVEYAPPAAIVERPSGSVSCMGCGVAVRLSAADRHLLHAEVEALGHGGVRGRFPRYTEVVFTRCRDCAAVRVRAEALVAAHPRLVARVGSVDLAVHQVECGLLALVVAGRPLPPVDATAADLGALLRLATVPGGSARWIGRFAPISTVPVASCTSSPWAHLTDGQRAACVDGAAALLAERLARHAAPVAVPPPPPEPAGDALPVPGGCLMCGVEAQEVPARAVARPGGATAVAAEVWSPRLTSPAALGGRGSPVPIVGHMCRVCAAAVEHVGSIGPTAMERSLVEHLGADLVAAVRPGDELLAGLRGWAALVVDALGRGESPPPPSPTRWAHVADPEGLAAGLRRELGVR